ncbi:uncharacterized protein LOC130087237 [Rhinichthys klamathensis goyatoka]|uniref:uncharacterized protein LOC130087237 n=1 Tax=Rhinichthys klamathensis goyatoka TaxID=3034132 RepID=UPI0024B52374|nr:uncharacterized protein LOC130087237 [Rhinichthys klamathensis goyatoka]
MNLITALLFFLSGLLGGYSLLPRQFYYVSNLRTWTDAQSYCRLKYTDLLFVYNEEDLKKMASLLPLFDYSKAWIGGFDLYSESESDSQNITDSQKETQNCLAINTDSWKLTKKSCTLTSSFFCSQSQGKRVVLRIKLNPGGQLDLNDPIIRSNMLAKINEKFNEIGFGDAIKIRLITKRETLRGKGVDETCT